MKHPVEVTTRYATKVRELPEAWAFVMKHIDGLGPSPDVKITPHWEPSDNEDEHPLGFWVVVKGTKEV